VTEDRYGIGYSGIGYRTSGEGRALSERRTRRPPTAPTPTSRAAASLWRFLFLYVNKAPNKPLDPIVGEFVKLILSKDGQEAVVKDGYMPLSTAQVQGELTKIK
jgi:phosphate transport system substrate-binding protein